MRILLDECLPVALRRHLSGHEVHTAEWAGFKTLKNGRLLQEAERSGYEAFLAVDQGVPHQQNLARRTIAIVVIRARTNQLEDLLPMMPAVLTILESILPGQIAQV